MRNIFALLVSIAALSLPAQRGIATPPPIAPNACSRLFCADFRPIILSSERRTIPAKTSILSEDINSSQIVAAYEDRATIVARVTTESLGSCAAENGRLVIEEASKQELRFRQLISYRRNLMWDKSVRCRALSGTVKLSGAGESAREVLRNMPYIWLLAEDVSLLSGNDIRTPVEARIDLQLSANEHFGR